MLAPSMATSRSTNNSPELIWIVSFPAARLNSITGSPLASASRSVSGSRVSAARDNGQQPPIFKRFASQAATGAKHFLVGTTDRHGILLTCGLRFFGGTAKQPKCDMSTNSPQLSLESSSMRDSEKSRFFRQIARYL